jgi:hypothetical protein
MQNKDFGLYKDDIKTTYKTVIPKLSKRTLRKLRNEKEDRIVRYFVKKEIERLEKNKFNIINIL